MTSTTITTPKTLEAAFNESLANATGLEGTDWVPYQEEEWLAGFKFALLTITFIFAIFGNGLLIISIVVFKKLRRMESILILNLAACDVLTAIFKIPFTLVIYKNPELYPFGPIGCKSIWPIGTYGTNSSVFTLVCIAIERYLTISSIRNHVTTTRLVIAIIFIHAMSIGAVIPYAWTLTYIVYYGTPYCYEAWYGTTDQEIYTVVLFLLQYGLPLLLIIVFYSASWFKIMKRNNKMIKISEEYERKIAWETCSRNKCQSSDTRNENNDSSGVTFETSQEDMYSEQSSTSTGIEAKEDTSLINVQPPTYEEAVGLISKKEKPEQRTTTYRRMRASSVRASFKVVPRKTGKIIRKIKMLRKPKYISHTAYVRHRQTIRTLKMFTTIVVVFAIFALPNQIYWLLHQFAPEIELPDVIMPVFNFLTFLNSLTNCWVYFAFNSTFRKAYKKILLTVLPCFQRCCKMPHLFSHDNITDQITSLTQTSSSCNLPNGNTSLSNNNNLPQSSGVQQSVFDDMFQDHLNNFEKYEHLYKTPDDEKDAEDESEQSTLISPKRPSKLKHRTTATTITSLITAITPVALEQTKSQSTANLSERKLSTGSRIFTMIPPLIPFRGSTQNVRKSSNTLYTPKHAHRPKSVDYLDDIDMENMVLRESIKKPKFKRRKSASDISDSKSSLRTREEVKSLPTSPERKPGVFSIFSQKSPRKKSSTIKPPVLESTISASTVYHDVEDNNNNNNNNNKINNVEEGMVIATAISGKATTTITAQNVKVATAYEKLKEQKREKFNNSRNDISLDSMTQECEKDDSTVTIESEIFASSIQDLSAPNINNQPEAAIQPSELNSTSLQKASISSNQELNQDDSDSTLCYDTFPTDASLTSHTPLIVIEPPQLETTTQDSLPKSYNPPPVKIPPIVPPKPNRINRIILTKNKKMNKQKTREEDSEVSKIRIHRSKQQRENKPTFMKNREKFERAISQESTSSISSSGSSVERRDSVKALKERQLVRKRSSSLEKSGHSSKDQKASPSAEASRVSEETTETVLIQQQDAIEGNNESKKQELSLQETPKDETINEEAVNHSALYTNSVLETRKDKKIVTHPAVNTNSRQEHVPVNKKKYKLYRRPDISVLLEHTLSLQSLNKEEETHEDVPWPYGPTDLIRQFSLDFKKQHKHHHDENVQCDEAENKGILEGRRTLDEYNLSPRNLFNKSV